MHLFLFEHCRPNTVELDKSILVIIVLRLLYTSGFNVSLKIDLVAEYFCFFNFQRRTVTSGDNE